MKIKIVTDSSANVRTAADQSIVSVPLKIVTDEKDYLINPIQKIVTIVGAERNWNMWCAGETALSRQSELNPPRIDEMAIYKGDEIVDQFDIVDERVVEPSSLLKVQLWKYNPAYFADSGSYAKRGCVDPISLACSFIGNADERIEMSIDELMEGYIWYWE